jgi:methylmalonyl-CoA mutase N-terminal domain/subunit
MMESLTDEIYAEALKVIDEIEAMGGMASAIVQVTEAMIRRVNTFNE